MVAAMRKQQRKGEPLLVGVGAVSEERAGRERTRLPRRPSELYKATRVGAEPPEALVELRARVSRDVLAACSIPPALVEGVTGQADREAQRQFTNLHARPRGALIAGELAASLESPGSRSTSGRCGAPTQWG